MHVLDTWFYVYDIYDAILVLRGPLRLWHAVRTDIEYGAATFRALLKSIMPIVSSQLVGGAWCSTLSLLQY